jgi:hypothetical protein
MRTRCREAEARSAAREHALEQAHQVVQLLQQSCRHSIPTPANCNRQHTYACHLRRLSASQHTSALPVAIGTAATELQQSCNRAATQQGSAKCIAAYLSMPAATDRAATELQQSCNRGVPPSASAIGASQHIAAVRTAATELQQSCNRAQLGASQHSCYICELGSGR